MADYQSMYKTLWGAITDAINLLQQAQIDTEEMFVSQEDPEIIVLDKPDED